MLAAGEEVVPVANFQVELNHRKYNENHRHLDATDRGRFALMHDGDIVKIYDDAESAYLSGVGQFGAERFAVKEIGAKPFSLGLRSLT